MRTIHLPPEPFSPVGPWSLVDEAGEEVPLGRKLRDFRGDPFALEYFTPPKHAASSGRVGVVYWSTDFYRTLRSEFFPHVFNLKIIRKVKPND